MAKNQESALKEYQSIFVVGADGAIGHSLVAAFEREGKSVCGTTRNQAKTNAQRLFLDLADPVDNYSLPLNKINTAILCAGVTCMERCRLDPITTRQINVENTVALAKRLVDVGVFVIFLSSNTVFDGMATFPKATDPTNPRTEYGRQKVEAEEQLLRLGDRVSVVRFSKIILPDMPLLTNWANDLSAGKTIHPFVDSVMAPVSISFAVNLLRLISIQQLPGITQVSASNDISYEYAARYVAARMNANVNLIEPISYKQAHILFSPEHTTLDTSRLAELGLDVPPPTHALEQIHLRCS